MRKYHERQLVDEAILIPRAKRRAQDAPKYPGHKAVGVLSPHLPPPYGTVRTVVLERVRYSVAFVHLRTRHFEAAFMEMGPYCLRYAIGIHGFEVFPAYVRRVDSAVFFDNQHPVAVSVCQ